MNRSLAIQQAKILKSLIELNKVSKILSTFIPAFKEKVITKEGKDFLCGSFNLGGTVSGRMSSSEPNLMQLPSSGTKYSKPIKQCFQAPDGWIMVGADFNALEARVDALLTKDPNKIKIYTQGYDSHSAAAITYWPDKMPDIDPNNVNSVNSIKDKYPQLRQASKAVSFSSLYGGTYHTLMKNSGFSEEEAKLIEQRYHANYQVSDQWKAQKLQEASKCGFATVAFGLKVRTPILKKTILNTDSTPYEALAEGRTVGNSLGQSFCMLTNRAANEFMERVYKSDHKYSIKPIAQIHDAIYLLIKAEAPVLRWVNQHLIECMEWQKLDEIKHDEVKLGAELSVFYPTWADEHTIPNRASYSYVKELLEEILNG